MSVCLSVRMEQLASHWKNFYEIWYLSIFRKSLKILKIRVSLKSIRMTDTSHEDQHTCVIECGPVLRNMKMFQREILDKFKTHFMFCNCFRKLYSFWDNVEKPCRAQQATDGSIIKVKVKVTLMQALMLCTGRMAHRGSRGIALPFHDHGTRRGWGVSVTPRPFFTPGTDPVPIVQEAGWAPGPVLTGAENLAPHRDSIPGPSSP